jgi:hypothetical protein
VLYSALAERWQVTCRLHKSPPLVPILSQMNPMQILPSYVFKIHFNMIPSCSEMSTNYESPASYYFLPFGLKYVRQEHIFKVIYYLDEFRASRH